MVLYTTKALSFIWSSYIFLLYGYRIHAVFTVWYKQCPLFLSIYGDDIFAVSVASTFTLLILCIQALQYGRAPVVLPTPSDGKPSEWSLVVSTHGPVQEAGLLPSLLSTLPLITLLDCNSETNLLFLTCSVINIACRFWGN